MNTLPKYLTQDELKRFFDAIESPRDKALFGLIYHITLHDIKRIVDIVNIGPIVERRNKYMHSNDLIGTRAILEDATRREKL
jgi:hypothetical protein